MEWETIEDSAIDAVAAMGLQRSANSRKLNTSAILPKARTIAWIERTADRHNNTCGQEELQLYYLELLQRAEALVEMLDKNCGATEEFPIRIYTDTKPTGQALRRHIDELRDAVGLLLEI